MLFLGSGNVWAGWTRCTAVSDLTSGGTFIIGYEATANSGVIVPMQNNGTATTSKAGYLYSGTTSGSFGSGTIDMSNVSTTSLYEVTIAASTTVEGAITIKCGDNYIGNTNTRNNLKFFTSEATTTSFTPTVGTNDVFTLKIAANGTYHTLQYNSSKGSERFAVYGGAQKNLVIYKKTTVNQVATPTFSPEATGIFFDAQTVAITTTTEGATIYYTTDGSEPTTSSSVYSEALNVSSTTTIKALATKSEMTNSAISTATYTFGPTFSSLEALVDADITSGTNVRVSFENVAITGVYSNQLSLNVKKGDHYINIYYPSEGVPSGWKVGDVVSGTMICPWKQYGVLWELSPAENSWTWSNLTHTAKTLQSLTISGIPTRTTYEAGEALNPAGLTVTAKYNVGADEDVTDKVEWTFDPETLSADNTSCNVRATVDGISSETYNVTGLTVNASRTLISIVVSGTPTKSMYEVGDTFNPEGLTVTANYDSGDPVDVSGDAVFSYSTDPLTYGTSSIDVTATYNEMTSATYACPITVNKKTPSIIIADMNLSLNDQDIEISATTTPANAELTYSIKSGSEYITLSENKISAKAVGTAVVEASFAGNDEYESATKSFNVVVNNISKVTWDLSIDETSTASETELSWVSVACSMVAAKTDASTATNNYYPGTPDKNYTSTRFYKNSTLTFTPTTGVTLGTITYTATTADYATALANSTWTNATATAKTDAEPYTVTITPTDGTKAVSATIGATTGASSVVVYYTGTPVAKVSKINLSGTYPTEFDKGDEFSHEGMVVTATYTDESIKDVTASAEFSGYDMSKVGAQTITVSYTENEKTVTTTYSITVNSVLTPAANGYEVVDFTEVYKDVTSSEKVNSYEGLSFFMTFSNGGGSNAPKYYNSGTSVRAYTDNTITVKAAENIKCIDIVWTAEKGKDTGVSITGIGTQEAVVTFSKTCSFSSITVVYKTYTKTITADKLATLYLPYTVAIPTAEEGEPQLKAYIAEKVDNSTIELVKLTEGQIPANTGVIVYADVTTNTSFVLEPTSTSITQELGANRLKGVLANTAVNAVTDYDADSYNYYALVKGASAVEFQKAAKTATLKANSAYLVLPASSEAKINFTFDDDEATGIQTSEVKSEEAELRIYNLSGQLVGEDYKGIVIKNGKKMLNK